MANPNDHHINIYEAIILLALGEIILVPYIHYYSKSKMEFACVCRIVMSVRVCVFKGRRGSEMKPQQCTDKQLLKTSGTDVQSVNHSSSNSSHPFLRSCDFIYQTECPTCSPHSCALAFQGTGSLVRKDILTTTYGFIFIFYIYKIVQNVLFF